MVALRWLPMAEKHRERPLNRKHDIVVEAADGRAKIRAAQRLWAIDRDLRRNPQTIFLAWRDIDPRDGGVQ